MSAAAERLGENIVKTSFHLVRLRRAGLATAVQAGRYTEYRLAPGVDAGGGVFRLGPYTLAIAPAAAPGGG